MFTKMYICIRNLIIMHVDFIHDRALRRFWSLENASLHLFSHAGISFARTRQVPLQNLRKLAYFVSKAISRIYRGPDGHRGRPTTTDSLEKRMVGSVLRKIPLRTRVTINQVQGAGFEEVVTVTAR